MFSFTYNTCPKMFHHFDWVCIVYHVSTLLEQELQFHLAYEIQFIYNLSFTQHFSENGKLTFLAFLVFLPNMATNL